MTRNENTRLMRISDATSDNRSFFASSFEKSLQTHRAVLKQCRNGFAVIVTVQRSGESHLSIFDSIPKNALETAVVGRHDHADIFVTTDQALSLRHVMVILSRDGKGNPFTRVLDLRSAFGVQDIDCNYHVSLAADGPLALRLADTALFVLPFQQTNEAFDENILETDFEKFSWPKIQPFIPETAPEEKLRDISCVTRNRSAISVVTDISAARLSELKDGHGLIKLHMGDASYTRAVSAVEQRGGVLIGRYERCDFNPKHIFMNPSVSRVHALVLAVDSRVRLFDTGSQNGICMGRRYEKMFDLSTVQKRKFGCGDMELEWSVD